MRHRSVTNSQRKAQARVKKAIGFTLIELMIAITVFLVIGAAAMNLFRQHAALFNDQQYQIGLNVSLRNALSQLENDVVNAGTGWYSGATSISSWPVGISIVNNTAGGGACHPAGTSTYTATCFDTLNIIAPDPNTPPGQVWIAPGTEASCSSQVLTSAGGTMTIAPVAPATQAQLIAGFTAGSQVVFMHVGTSGTLMTTAILKTGATANGTNVNLSFNTTNTDGTNASSANDQLNLTLAANTDPALIPTTLTNTFCNSTDWVVKLAPIVYSVDTAIDPTGPTLVRTENGIENPIASQIIGFKVGASTVVLNGAGAAISSSAQYCYNSASLAAPCYDNQYDQVRSVRISLIGRTPPRLYTNSNVYQNGYFTNSFDGQPYKIQALSIIVNPRNLSMND